MKGIRLITKICIASAFLIGLIMALLNLYPSWSQHAGEAQDPLLYSTLFLIALAFYGTSFDHPNRHRHLFWLTKKIQVRFEHIARFTAFMFGGVLTFSVNSPIHIIEVLHFVFTGLGIGFGYLLLLFYYKEKKYRLWSYVGVAFGIIGFMLGFLFNVYSISWAETIAAFPLGIFLYISLIK